MRPLVVFRGNTDPTLISFDAEVVGTAAAETLQVAAGTDLSFTPGAGDRVEFADALSAYSFSRGGNMLTVENTVTGTKAELFIQDATELAFSDGTVTASPQLTDNGFSISVGGENAAGGINPANVVRDAGDISGIAGGSAGKDTQAPTVDDQTVTVDENVPVGTGLGRVSAEDNAGGSGVASFSLTGGGTATDFVDIKDDGRLTLTQTGANDPGFGDFETAPNSFTVNVTATDQAGNESLPATVTLSVADIDDTKPTIAANQTLSVPDNAETGDAVGQLQASDDADGAGISGFFTSGEAGDFVNIAPDGTLSLSAAGAGDPAFSDFETSPNTFTLTVEAEDGAGNVSDPRDVTLEIIEGDDVAPTVPANQGLSYDPEATGSGDSIGQVQASDDGPNGGTGVADFEITGGAGAGQVEIADDGTLTLTSDASGDIAIDVTAEDAAGNVSAVQSLTITADTGGFF